MRHYVKRALFTASPALGSKSVALWDSLAPVLQGRFSARGTAKYIIRGLCPGIGGAFTYFGTRVYFPRGSAIFQSACEQEIYEQEVTEWLCRLVEPGTTFLDIGANIGLTSIPVLRRVPESRVLSFEPSPNSLPYLERTRAESDVAARWEVLGKAAGSDLGVVRFCVASPRHGVFDGLLDTQRAAGLSHAIDVPMTTVDAEWRRLGSPAVACMKIDVEGAETLVLAGSKALIAQERPRIVLEWKRENLAAYSVPTEELLTYANARDYEVLAFPGLSPVTGPRLLEIHMLRTEMFLLAPKG